MKEFWKATITRNPTIKETIVVINMTNPSMIALGSSEAFFKADNIMTQAKIIMDVSIKPKAIHILVNTASIFALATTLD